MLPANIVNKKYEAFLISSTFINDHSKIDSGTHYLSCLNHHLKKNLKEYEHLPDKNKEIERVFQHQAPNFLDHQSNLHLSLLDTRTRPKPGAAKFGVSPEAAGCYMDQMVSPVSPSTWHFLEHDKEGRRHRGTLPHRFDELGCHLRRYDKVDIVQDGWVCMTVQLPGLCPFHCIWLHQM